MRTVQGTEEKRRKRLHHRLKGQRDLFSNSEFGGFVVTFWYWFWGLGDAFSASPCPLLMIVLSIVYLSFLNPTRAVTTLTFHALPLHLPRSSRNVA